MEMLIYQAMKLTVFKACTSKIFREFELSINEATSALVHLEVCSLGLLNSSAFTHPPPSTTHSFIDVSLRPTHRCDM